MGIVQLEMRLVQLGTRLRMGHFQPGMGLVQLKMRLVPTQTAGLLILTALLSGEFVYVTVWWKSTDEKSIISVFILGRECWDGQDEIPSFSLNFDVFFHGSYCSPGHP